MALPKALPLDGGGSGGGGLVIWAAPPPETQPSPTPPHQGEGLGWRPVKLLRGRITRTDWLLLGLAALFVARFVWLSAG